MKYYEQDINKLKVVSAALANGEAVTSLQQAFQTIPYPGIGKYIWPTVGLLSDQILIH